MRVVACLSPFLSMLALWVAMAIGGSAVADDQPLAEVKERVILFAPVSVGSLAEDYPEAPTDYASGMAARISVLVPGAQANFSDTLPASDDPIWDQGPLGAASGAHAVILTKVVDYQVEAAGPGIGAAEMAIAKVHMRALNAKGEEVWHKVQLAKVPNQQNPKNIHVGGPNGKAAWEGCKKGLLSFKYWLGEVAEQDLDKRITSSGDPGPGAAELIDVMVESDPAGADIYVNGVFRGTTPMKVPLPKMSIQLRLQRQGHQVWSNTFVPAPDMKLKPGLEKLP